MKNSARNSATPGRPFRKGADSRRHVGPKARAGRPPSAIKQAFLNALADSLPVLLAIIASKKSSDADKIRAIDVVGKYAGLQSVDIEIVRPTEMVIRELRDDEMPGHTEPYPRFLS